MFESASIAASLTVSAGIWLWLIARRVTRRPLIPFARRRAVPWLGQDVLFIFLSAYLIALVAAAIAGKIAGGEAAPAAAQHKLQSTHPAEQLLREGDWREIALATFVAVVVAPLYEEFMFRVLLQGWLEALWSRRRLARRHLPAAVVLGADRLAGSPFCRDPRSFRPRAAVAAAGDGDVFGTNCCLPGGAWRGIYRIADWRGRHGGGLGLAAAKAGH